MSKKHLCPVCGYNQLHEAPYGKHDEPSFEICPCCGFEFGFDGKKDGKNFKSFRKDWIKAGSPWFIEKLKPRNWDYRRQLENI